MTSIEERVDRVESQLAIQQLPIRYALAVDGRDLDAWVGCFRPDVDMGRHGRGRDVLRPAHRTPGARLPPVGPPDLRPPRRVHRP